MSSIVQNLKQTADTSTASASANQERIEFLEKEQIKVSKQLSDLEAEKRGLIEKQKNFQRQILLSEQEKSMTQAQLKEFENLTFRNLESLKQSLFKFGQEEALESSQTLNEKLSGLSEDIKDLFAQFESQKRIQDSQIQSLSIQNLSLSQDLSSNEEEKSQELAKVRKEKADLENKNTRNQEQIEELKQINNNLRTQNETLKQIMEFLKTSAQAPARASTSQPNLQLFALEQRLMDQIRDSELRDSQKRLMEELIRSRSQPQRTVGTQTIRRETQFPEYYDSGFYDQPAKKIKRPKRKASSQAQGIQDVTYSELENQPVSYFRASSTGVGEEDTRNPKIQGVAIDEEDFSFESLRSSPDPRSSYQSQDTYTSSSGTFGPSEFGSAGLGSGTGVALISETGEFGPGFIQGAGSSFSQQNPRRPYSQPINQRSGRRGFSQGELARRQTYSSRSQIGSRYRSQSSSQYQTPRSSTVEQPLENYQFPQRQTQAETQNENWAPFLKQVDDLISRANRLKISSNKVAQDLENMAR